MSILLLLDARGVEQERLQVHGRARLIEERDALRTMVLDLSELMEPPGSAWAVERLDPAYVDKLIGGIIGFAIDVQRVDVQLRLSQQNNAEDRQRVKAALEHGTLRQRQVAADMFRYLPG